MTSLISFLINNNIPYEENVDLKKKTWIHRGGNAKLFIKPTDSNQLEVIGKYLYQEKHDFLLVGHTSNLYILNTTNIPVVVSTLHCNKYEVVADKILCEAGVGVIRLAKSMVDQGIGGFECLTGLPGTIGAAICNNSSCKDNSISKLLVSAEVLTDTGDIVTMLPEEFEFKFRTSVFKENKCKGIILSAILKAEKANVDLLRKKSQETDAERVRLLEGHAKNLGCTVNRCWSLGTMPVFYKYTQRITDIALTILSINEAKRKKILKKQLFRISGFSSVEPYVSDKNPIVFMWLDEHADEVFDRYLLFMEKVYRTKKIEIQIVK